MHPVYLAQTLEKMDYAMINGSNTQLKVLLKTFNLTGG